MKLSGMAYRQTAPHKLLAMGGIVNELQVSRNAGLGCPGFAAARQLARRRATALIYVAAVHLQVSGKAESALSEP
jgi:hypothetical protein